MCCIVPNITLSLFCQQEIISIPRVEIERQNLQLSTYNLLLLNNNKPNRLIYEYREHTKSDAQRDTGVLYSFYHSPRWGLPQRYSRGNESRQPLYTLLTRLKNAEMLTYRWVESNSGPPRKYFLLTEKGEAFYKELYQTWEELSNGVNALTNKKDKTPE